MFFSTSISRKSSLISPGRVLKSDRSQSRKKRASYRKSRCTEPKQANSWKSWQEHELSPVWMRKSHWRKDSGFFCELSSQISASCQASGKPRKIIMFKSFSFFPWKIDIIQGLGSCRKQCVLMPAKSWCLPKQPRMAYLGVTQRLEEASGQMVDARSTLGVPLKTLRCDSSNERAVTSKLSAQHDDTF